MLPDDPEIEIKPMFGNLGAFVHGNMFAGLFGPDVGVRLDEARREELAAVDGSGPFGPEERPMGGYLSLPRGWRASPGRRRGLGGAAHAICGGAATEAEETQAAAKSGLASRSRPAGGSPACGGRPSGAGPAG